MNRRDAIMPAEAVELLENRLIGEFDARIWAREFVKCVKQKPSIATDEGCILGWFANAIMAGYDHRERERPN